MSIEAIVKEFSAVAANPKGQLKAYKDAGKKCIGVMPYYAPEELVYAAGMMPFGMWGSNSKTIQRAKEYCATFYCTIAQLDLEMLLDGTMDLLDGVITPTICDTLRPMSQNIRVAMSEKLPCIFLAHPQNRFADFGKQFCMDQYDHVKGELEKIAGHEIKSEDIAKAIKVYNKSRAARREFVKLASEHCDVIDPIMRSAVLKAAWFMDKAEYTEKLNALNAELKALPAAKWNGVKVVTSGAGAAAIAIVKLLLSSGFRNVTMCDRKGAIYAGRDGLNWIKEEMAQVTNLDKKAGSLADMLVGADVFIGVSAPGMVTKEMVQTMNKDAIVFAMANPTPEIMPDEAKAGGVRVMATGRSDFPNQVNNVLCFPGLFKGALSVRARDINNEMKLAAAYAIADLITDADRSEENIIPGAFDPRVAEAVANAVAKAARETGVARL